jgi:hypothetical protein
MNNYMNIIKSISAVALCALALTSCHNSDWEFDDYGCTSAYFAMQHPVRVVTLGEDDQYNIDIDNRHQIEIQATFAGVYTNKEDRKLKYVVDPTLLEGETNVELLPADYYTLEDPSTLTIPSGKIIGGTILTLNDNFFNDPKSVKVNYVLPIRIVGAENVDSILEGRDYQLLAITYKNKYAGLWCAETDDLWKLSEVKPEEKDKTYSHKYTDALVTFTTVSLNTFSIDKNFIIQEKKYDEKENKWEDKEVARTMTFKCTVADNGDIVVTDAEGNQVGTGKYAYRGIQDFTEVDRKADYITLDYKVTLTSEIIAGPAEWHYECKGKYMIQSRGNKKENWK